LDISEIRQPEAPSEAAGIRYSPHHAALSRASRPLPFRSASTRADAAAIASVSADLASRGVKLSHVTIRKVIAGRNPTR
jgi:hypothetical protein